MPELPTGTVTFLFTDIEGSTSLLKQLGPRYGGVLADHQRIVRASFEGRGGEEIDTQGDAFFVVFRRAKDAVAAAADAQRALASHPWPEGAAVRVRMGMHTGEPSLSEAGFVSLAIHRAARIASAGHGGQVLLSNTTRDLVEDELPEGVGLRDLGEHRLKDIDRPERLFQLVIEGLPADFRPLKTLESQPVEATPFAGREDELAEAAEAAVAAERRRRRTLLAAALMGVLAAAVAIPVFALGRGDSGDGQGEIRGNAVGIIDPEENAVIGDVAVGVRPGPVAFGSAALWVANLDDETVARVDPRGRRVIRQIPVEGAIGDLAAAADGVWALTTTPAVVVRRIDPRFDNVAATIRIASLPGGSGGLALGEGVVWVAPSLGLLTRVDPATNEVVGTTDARNSPTSVAVGRDAVWVADGDANTVTRIDSANVVTTIPVGHAPSGIAVGKDAVWVTETLGDAVVRIDPIRGAVVTTIAVGRSPVGIAVGAGAVWVANSRDGTVSRIDPNTNRVVETIDVGGSPQDVAVGDGKVWVSVQERVGRGADAGGSVRINAEEDVDSLDPAVGFSVLSWQLGYATCAKLLTYPDKPAPAGSQLVAEVAEALPERSADGRTYTFTIRKGFRFSPPSNEPVSAETFKYSLERSLDPRLQGPARGLMGDIVGAQAFIAGKARHISGIVARRNTLTVRLVEAAPDFLARITLPFFCPVPIGTPVEPGGVRLVPSAGPYYASEYTPGQGVVLRQNPNYAGARPRRPREIRVAVGVGKAQSVRDIEAGRADYALDGVPRNDVARLTARYGPRSGAARRGRQQYFLSPVLNIDLLLLNSSRRLFSDVRLRRAVAFAIDREALARHGTPLSPLPGKPTDQYLPPGMLGFRDADLYPSRPDVVRARRLAAGRRGRAVLWTCNVPPCPQIAEIVKSNLAPIGIEVDVEEFPSEVLNARLTGSPPVDIVPVAQFAVYQDPSLLLNRFLGNFLAGRDRRGLDAAARLSGPRRYLRYADLDAELARDVVPAVAYANATSHDFFSARVGCQIFQPVYGMDLAALCIRG